jgi:hypothetical protein
MHVWGISTCVGYTHLDIHMRLEVDFRSLLLSIYIFVCLLVLYRVSLYSPGCPGTHFIDQAGFKLRNPPASTSRVLGLKV